MQNAKIIQPIQNPYQILDHCLDAAVALNSQLKIIYFNEAFASLVGASEQRILQEGMFYHWLSLSHKIDFASIAHRPGYIETSFKTKTGRSGQIRVGAFPFKNMNGQDDYLVLIRDMSEMDLLQKKYQDEVKNRAQIIDILKNEVAEKEDAFQQLFSQKADLILLNTQLDRKLFELSFLLEISEASQLVMNQFELTSMVIEKLMSTFWFEFGAFLYDENQNGQLMTRSIRQQKREQDLLISLDQPIAVPRHHPIVESAFKMTSSILADAERDKVVINLYQDLLKTKIHDFLCVPLCHKGSEYGVLHLVNSSSEPAIGEDDISVINSVANQVSMSIENLQLYHHSITDELTHLNNLRYFQSRLMTEIQRSQRGKTPVALVLLDIDHFKQVNDTYGHPVGDIVLQKVAQSIASLCRKSDVAARYGGEEFVLILPETDATGGQIVAEKIRKKIEGMVVQTHVGEIRVTASLGVSVYPDLANDPTILVNTADQALYEAKKDGRNRTILYLPPT